MVGRRWWRARRVSSFGVLVWAAVTQAGVGRAQRPGGGSHLVATDHWSYEYIRLLRERGYLPRLNPLVQPYRAADIRSGLAPLDPDSLPEPARRWARLLREEFGPAVDPDSAAVRWSGYVAGGVRASSSLRLDPLRPRGDADAWPRGQVGAWAEVGPITAETRLLGDLYFNDDPDGLDPGQRRGARSDHAYLAADFSVVSFAIGRFARNWFAAGTPGLLVSNAATPYPQLGLELRVGRFALRSLLGELETLDGRKRYLVAHRLDYQSPNLIFSLGESNLHAPQSGGPSLRFLNPLEFLFFDHDNAPYDAVQNLMVNGQAWARLGRVVLYAEGLLDDIDVHSEGPAAEPTLYAFTLGWRLAPLISRLGLGAEYQQVSAWAYRTPNVVDRYSYLERGLGQNFSDYDRLSLSMDWFAPVSGLRVSPTLVLQRQGEGNFRDSVPPMEEYLGSPSLFLGVQERTLRLALAGRYQPLRFAWLGWDVGQNFIRNRDHVPGRNESTFAAAGELGIRLDFPRRRQR